MYNCPDDSFINKNYYRILRFLILIDPTVNICAIREADGFLNNLECHNLRMFEYSDRLFYIPPLGVGPNLIHETRPKTVFNSYSLWLQLYKNILAREFFSTHQNIYDFLAGFFTFKLKIKPEFYYTTAQRLHRQIDAFKTETPESIANKYAPEDNSYSLSNMPIQMMGRNVIMTRTLRELLLIGSRYESIIELFELGFDEILLLDIFKELVSFKFPLPTAENKWQITYNTDDIRRIQSLFISYDSINIIL